EFANDADLNAQAARWLGQTANVRCHSTLQERPVDRFERDERAVLQPLAPAPFPRLGRSLQPAPSSASDPRIRPVSVERRALRVYDQIAEAGR
ncbi:MAG: hypothetical protein AAGD06_34205, partial [Acidobacteriota bacterium]